MIADIEEKLLLGEIPFTINPPCLKLLNEYFRSPRVADANARERLIHVVGAIKRLRVRWMHGLYREIRDTTIDAVVADRVLALDSSSSHARRASWRTARRSICRTFIR